MINYFQIYSGACSFFLGGGGKDIFTYIIQNVQLKKQNAALSSIFVTIYIYEKKTYIFSLKDGNNTTVNVEASTSSGRDDIWSNFHDYTVQPTSTSRWVHEHVMCQNPTHQILIVNG